MLRNMSCTTSNMLLIPCIGFLIIRELAGIISVAVFLNRYVSERSTLIGMILNGTLV